MIASRFMRRSIRQDGRGRISGALSRGQGRRNPADYRTHEQGPIEGDEATQRLVGRLLAVLDNYDAPQFSANFLTMVKISASGDHVNVPPKRIHALRMATSLHC